MEQMFLNALMNKYRYDSSRGPIPTEALWDLPLRSSNGFDLNSVAVSLNNDLKALGEQSFVDDNADSKARTIAEEKLEIVKHVIAYKKAVLEAGKNAAARAQQKQQLLEVLERKSNQELESLSKDDLMKRIQELG